MRPAWVTALGVTAAGCLGLLWLVECGGGSTPSTALDTSSSLRIVMESGLTSLDPHRLYETNALSVLENVFETLVQQDRNLKAVPGLAATWETLEGPRWRVQLRSGVRFHDGSLLSAEDVKFSYERVMADRSSDFGHMLGSVDRVLIVDSSTLDFVLNKPYALVVNLGSIPVVPAGRVRRDGQKFFDGMPVGTGPYRVDSWSRGRWVKLKRFARHWGSRRLAFESVLFSAVEDPAARLRMVARGQADIVQSIPVGANLQGPYREVVQPSPHVHHLGFDCARQKSPYVVAPRNPFLNARVRRAVAAAIDTRALVHDVFADHADPATQLVGPSIFGFNPNVRPPAFDPVAAKEQLFKAGLAGGFRVTLDVPSVRQAVGEYVQRALGEIGVAVDLNVLPRDRFYAKLDRRDTSMYVLGWACTSGDASELFEYCLHTPDAEARLGMKSASGYSDAELDALIERALGEGESPERLSYLKEAMQQVMAEMPLIPLYVPENRFGVSTRVEYVPRLDGHILAEDARLAR